MFKPKFTKPSILFLLIIVIGGGFFYSVQAENIPNLFWRVVQKGQHMFFQYGNLAAPVDKAVVTGTGQVGFDSTATGDPMPSASALLELKAINKAVLVTRVSNENSIPNPINGMMAYVNNLDCFKVYQAGDWSECFGTARALTIGPDRPDGQGELGDIYVNETTGGIEIYDGTTWLEISQSLVDVGTTPPVNPIDGQIFYNTDTEEFFVYSDGAWVLIGTDFATLVSSKTGCERIDYSASRGKEIACPNNKFAEKIYYEANAWTNGLDNLQIPEIIGIECCSITYVAGVAPAPDPDPVPDPLVVSCQSWVNGRPMGEVIDLYAFGHGRTAAQCLTSCIDWIEQNGVAGQDYTCPRHTNGDCHGVVTGHDSVPKNTTPYHDCDGCQTNFCTTAP